MSEVNKVIRLLEGTRLKFTSTLLLKDGKKVELQHDRPLDVFWNDALRGLLLGQRLEEYGAVHPIIPWAEVSMIMTETNPEKGTT